MDYLHGNKMMMCQDCYNKIMKDNGWYKQGCKDTMDWVKDIVLKSGTYEKVKERILGAKNEKTNSRL
jgi:hypothetical protein